MSATTTANRQKVKERFTLTHRHSKPTTNIRSEEEHGLTDEDHAWLDAPAVGAEIIYDRYSVPGEEISKSDFLAQPSRVLESESRFMW